MTPHDAVAELLGAYALDALEAEETAVVAAHVATCPRCAAEVDEYRSVAALLANAGGDAPQGLWDRISSELQAPTTAAPDSPPRLLPRAELRSGRADGRGDRGVAPGDDRQAPFAGGTAEGPAAGGGPAASGPSGRDRTDGAPAGSGPAARRARSRWQRSVLAVAGAAAAVVIALLAVQVGQLDGRVGTLNALASRQNMPALAEQALADPQAQHVALVDASLPRRTLADLVILPDGTAYLVESSLPALPPTETYQLWGVIDGQAISLGLLGRRPGVEAFTFDASTPVRQFAVTAEPAGGVVMSTSAPVAAGTVHGD